MAPEPPLEFVPTMGYGPATIESVEETLQQALELLDDGASWAQDGLRVPGGAADGGVAFCAVGALEAAAPKLRVHAADRLLERLLHVLPCGAVVPSVDVGSRRLLA